MKTDDLVSMLARGADAAQPAAPRHRYAIALGWGTLGATLLMAIFLGVRRDLAQAVMWPMFWVKLAYVAVLAVAATVAAVRLSIPGARTGKAPAAIAATLLAIWALGAWTMIDAPPAERRALFFGATWRTCPLLVALLAAPVFAGVLWAMRGLGPTRLRVAGAGAGFAAGAIGALVYALHCPELAAPFLGFWYLLGMLIPTAVGALVGPRLLRW